LAVATGHADTTDGGCLHLLELGALGPLGLASADLAATTTEGTLGATATPGAATGTPAEATGGTAAGSSTGSTGPTAGTARTATATGAPTCGPLARPGYGRTIGHHAGVRARTAGAGTARAGTGGASLGAAGAARTGHRLRRRERVVARTGRAPALATALAAVGTRTLTAHAL